MSNDTTRREFVTKSLLASLGAGSIALLFGGNNGSQGPAGPPGPNQFGATNVLPRWTDGPGGIFGNSALSDDGANVSSSESFLPSGDNVQNLGSAAQRWSTVNAVGIGNPGGGLNLTVNSTLIPVSDNSKDLGSV